MTEGRRAMMTNLTHVQPSPPANRTLRAKASSPNWVQETYGLCGWQGSVEELRRLALAPDIDIEEELDTLPTPPSIASLV